MWEALAPVFGISVVALAVTTAVVLRGPLGKAIAERLAGRGAGHEDAHELEVLRTDLSDLRGQLSEVQERLDFAERLLTQQREAARLEGPA
jgi:hypothetical protein